VTVGDVLLDDLREQLSKGHVLVIVGAGVSAAVSGRSPAASWTGLLRDGCGRAAQVARGPLPAGWAEMTRKQIDSGDLDWMLGAAEEITRRLGGRKGGEYRRWLSDSLGNLPLTDRFVIEALAGLGMPLATTNYDGLIEQVTGWPSITWRDGARVQEVLRGDKQAVMHLHGYWEDPESVVLGIRSYEDVLGDAAAQSLQRAVMSLRSVLFVGFGAGLADPNFGALLNWVAGTFPDSKYRHFRLCTDGELDEVRAQHPGEERVAVLGYGARHSDLLPFLRSLGATGKPADVVAAPLASAAGLPPPPICVGRDDLVKAVVDGILLRPPMPVPVLGGPGIGKTTVCLAALHDPWVAERFGERRWFVRCDGATDAAGLVNGIAAELGAVGEGAAGTLLSRVTTALAESPAAVALDNLETPWQDDTLAVEEALKVLAAVPDVVLVVTVRGAARPGGVRWRHTAQVLPLGLPDARTVFLGIAGEEFAADPELDGLLEAVDRVPLAIELLAYNAEAEPNLAGLARRWHTERATLLQRGTADARQLSVPVSVELSLASPMLMSEGRRLLTLLGQLPDGVAKKDFDAVFPEHGARAAANLRQLGLAYDDKTGRLRVLAPIREHVAAEHPAAAGDLDRAVGHYCDLARSEGGRVGRAGGAEAAERVAAEAGNVTRMIGLAIDAGRWRDVADAAWGLSDYMRFTGADLPGLWDRILHRMGIGTTPSQHAKILFAAGRLVLDRSDYEGARARFEEALPLYRRAEDLLGEANCIRRLGGIALARSDYDRARARYEEALPLYRRAGSVLGEAHCIRGLGDIALDRSGYDGARARYEEALPLYRRAGSVLGEANCIKGLGNIALMRSDHGAARARFEEALPLYRRAGNVHGEANCIKGLGDIALMRSDYEGARARFEEALPLYRRAGNVHGEANCRLGLGDVARDQSEFGAARALYKEALSLYERIRDPYSIGLAHHRLVGLASGDERRAYAAAARESWVSIDRQDLLSELDREFGGDGPEEGASGDD
jgi:tetratricopeptide (TPR) repeat protein